MPAQEASRGLPHTLFVAELPDFSIDLLQDFARSFQFVLVRARQFRRIGKRPMQTRGHTGKDRATLRLCFTANGDDKWKKLTRFENVKHGLRSVSRNVDPDFSQGLHRQRIQFARLEASAVRFEEFTTDLVEQRRRHLASRAVVHANEQNLLFHRPTASRISREQVKAFRVTIA